MIICENCGTQNEDFYNYCYNCGFPLKSHLKHAEAQRLLGLTFAFESLGLLDQTIKAYEQLLKVYPNYADIRYKAAIAYEARGDYETAIKHLQHALKINPNYVQARIKLGELYAAIGKYQESLVELKTALSIRPKYTYADVHNNIGVIYEILGDIKQAKRYYKKAISLNPKFGKAYYNLANVLLDQRNYTEAVGLYRKALECKYDTPEVHNNLGLALMKQEEYKEAEHELKRAIELDPRLINPYINLIELYFATQQFDKLSSQLKELKERFPHSPEVKRLLQRLRKRGLSLRELEDISTEDTTSSVGR